MVINWIHLDFKGVMPDESRLIGWIRWLAGGGFTGVVLEYEDRVPWRSWPGTFRPGLALDAWRRVIDAARQQGMEVVPLIQTHGHLEWLLKHDRWAAWRENGCWNELCPQRADVLPAIRAWLDEIVAMHGRLSYLHIGGDETWNLATCPACRAAAEASPDGKLAVYIRHLEQVAQEVTARGIRPLIWADAFWREKRMDLVQRLPREVVLCDWQYSGGGPWDTAAELGAQGHKVLGCSAIRSSYDLAQCQADLTSRLTNIRGWQGHGGVAGLIHTTWGRTRSLLPQYGPWEGWLPAMIEAGRPGTLSSHPLHAWIERVDSALTGPLATVTPLVDELESPSLDDPWSDACRRWWVLALRWRWILEATAGNARSHAALRAVHQHIGVDPDYINHRRVAHRKVSAQAEQWEAAVRQFFAERGLSDVDEFVASRLAVRSSLWTADWAEGIIPDFPPRTAR